MFQDSYAALDPADARRRRSSAEPLADPEGRRPRRRGARGSTTLLDQVGLPRRRPWSATPTSSPAVSCQRIGLARALALQPRLIVADEPVSSASTCPSRRRSSTSCGTCSVELGLAYVVISPRPVRRPLPGRPDRRHVPRQARRGGARARRVPRRPLHPYTHALIEAVPEADRGGARPSAGAPQRVSCPARSTRPPAAGSAPAARWPRTSAPPRSRRCGAPATRSTRSPATSRWRPRPRTGPRTRHRPRPSDVTDDI